MNKCKYVSSKTCWFLHEQTNSKNESNYENELSEEDEWNKLLLWARGGSDSGQC